MARAWVTGFAGCGVLALLVAACGGPGAADAGVDADLSRALVFEFETRPVVPGDGGDRYDAYMEAASFTLREIRALGDVSPGGEETFRPELTISWPGGIEELVFDAAPAGLYSHLLFEVAAYRIEGMLVPSGDDPVPYVLQDAPPSFISISLDLDELEHEGDERTEVEIEIDLRELVNAVSWELVSPQSGVLLVDDSSDQIAVVRATLPGAFEVDD